MKVLYIGVYKDGTGWGNAAQNYILALDAVGIEVVPRAIRLNNRVDAHIHPRILELEKNSAKNCDVCIQNILPDMMSYDGHFKKNIGLFFSETTHFKNTNWAQHLNMMDEIWVPNLNAYYACGHSEVTTPTFIINCPCDTDKYAQSYKPYPIEDIKDRFVFYTIGEVTRRKNLIATLKAFHLEFSKRDNASLLIVGNVPGHSQIESNKIIRAMIQEVKTTMALYPKESDYNNEIIITQWLTDEEIMRIHKTGSCFVLPSYGEGWCIPGFDAMAMGNPVILSDEGGPAQYVKQRHNGFLIDGRYEPVFIKREEVQADKIWCSNEDWFSIDVNHLRFLMRDVYEDKELRDKVSANGIDRAYDFSHEKIGEKMKERLNG